MTRSEDLRAFREWGRQYRLGNKLFRDLFILAPAIDNEFRVQTFEWKPEILEAENTTPELEEQLALAEEICGASEAIDFIQGIADAPTGEATIPKRERFLIKEDIKSTITKEERESKEFRRATRSGQRVYVRTALMVPEKEAPPEILEEFKQDRDSWRRQRLDIDSPIPDSKRPTIARNARLTFIMCLGQHLSELQESERFRQNQGQQETA